MADRAKSGTSPKRGKTPSSTSAKSAISGGRSSSGNKTPGSRQRSSSPKSKGNSSSPNRRSSSKSPSRKSGSSKASRNSSPGRVKSSKSIPKSAKSTDSKRSMRSAKSDKAMETGVSKGCSSITGKRVLAFKEGIEQKGLTTTDMSGQGLTFVQTSLFNRKDVGILDFSSNNIRGLPPDIKKMTSLVHLDLSKNGIRCTHPNDFAGMPNEISHLPNLEIIIISECNLPFIPPAIWKCKHLKILDISRNKINILVPEIGNLEQLKHLNAQQTNIGTLPPEIAFCQELEELLLWGNSIESLPETMREMPKLQSMTINFRSFCSMVDNYMDNLLKKGQIQSEHIPPVIFEMQGLEILDLGDTKINTLPEKCLAQLKELYLQNNYFLQVPEMILSLDTLQILDISGNSMLSLPDEMSSLKHLSVFRANDNKFREVTPIGMLTQLVELSLGGNELETLPDEIGKLSKLKTLILDRNQLKSLPDTIIQLKELHTLDLTENALTALPVNFYKMSNSLTTAHMYQKIHKHGLWLHKNPLTTPPQEVWKTDNPQNIYNYMKKLQIKKTENLNRQKLILIGESQCGKTSLMHTMVSGKTFRTHEIQDSTKLIDFKAWRTENNVDFLVLDLGGAEVYQNTHPLFLDANAMYLLVYDHRKYTVQNHHQAIGLWLDILYMQTPGAVLKLVGTQCDNCYPDFIETIKEQVQTQVEGQLQGYRDRIDVEIKKVQDKMGNADGALSSTQLQMLKEQLFRLMRLKQNPLRIVWDIALVSSADGVQGIQELVQNIEITAVDKTLLPNGQKEIPEEWGKFRMALKQQKEYCLTMEQLTEKAAEHGVNLIECLRHLRDMGDVLWFDNIPGLKNQVFYRPRSLVLTLQGLFNHDMDNYLNFDENRVFSSKGDFDLKLFEQAKEHYKLYGEISRNTLMCFWFYQYLAAEKFDFLVDLIPNLDLCYTIPQAEVPLHRHEFQPLMVMPCFNHDKPPEDTTAFWSDEIPPNLTELTAKLTFPIFYPSGLFEKMTCRIQKHTLTRTDWQDLVYAQLDHDDDDDDEENTDAETYLYLMHGLDHETYDSVISIKIRSTNLEAAKSGLSKVHSDFQSLIQGYPGLVWYTGLAVRNPDDGIIEECFPKSVFNSTINVKRL